MANRTIVAFRSEKNLCFVYMSCSRVPLSQSKKSHGFISFNTLLSVFHSVDRRLILIVVISVMNWFQAQIRTRYWMGFPYTDP